VGLTCNRPAIERPVNSQTECLKLVRRSIRNATLCVEQAVRAQDSHAKEWFAKGAIYWRDIGAYWLQVCEMYQEHGPHAYPCGQEFGQYQISSARSEGPKRSEIVLQESPPTRPVGENGQ
jgi:hypothetical protein